MTVDEWGRIVVGLKAAYKQSNFLSDPETIEFWYLELKDMDFNTVARVAQDHIKTSQFPPALSDFFAVNRLTGPEAWSKVQMAIRNSTYHAAEEFEKLPLDIQKVIGSPSVLRSWGLQDDAIGQSVTRSTFIKEYEAISGKTLMVDKKRIGRIDEKYAITQNSDCQR